MGPLTNTVLIAPYSSKWIQDVVFMKHRWKFLTPTKLRVRFHIYLSHSKWLIMATKLWMDKTRISKIPVTRYLQWLCPRSFVPFVFYDPAVMLLVELESFAGWSMGFSWVASAEEAHDDCFGIKDMKWNRIKLVWETQIWVHKGKQMHSQKI